MERPSQAKDIALGMGVGAALLYYLDPRAGRSRRARLRDRMVHGVVKAENFVDGVRADIEERPKALKHLVRHAIHLDAREEVDDGVLVARVRSKLGKHVTHPGSLRVEAFSGQVRLGGPILADEVAEALHEARRVPGVRKLENRLEIHARPGKVPGLQGRGHPSHEKPEILRDHWSPLLRLLAGSLGLTLFLSGLRRSGFPGFVEAAAGSGLAFRAWSNRPLSAA